MTAETTAEISKARAALNAAKAGQSDGFRLLYELYSRYLLNIATRILGDQQESEDVLQEAFIKAFQDVSKFENEQAFAGWMKRVILNRSIDIVRRRKLKIISLEEHAEDIIEEEEETEYDVAKLQECIAKLPDSYRIILSLFLFEELSHREIATMLNISEGTSKSQYHRAKKKLLLLLRESNEK